MLTFRCVGLILCHKSIKFTEIKYPVSIDTYTFKTVSYGSVALSGKDVSMQLFFIAQEL